MRRCLHSVVGLSLAVTSAASYAAAQVPAAGDRDPNGRVLAKIVAKMGEPGAYGHPVKGLSLFVVTETGERVAIRTDAAGVASTWLRPGTYRFVARAPIEWNGKAYTWDMIIPVQVGMGAISLSETNATRIVALVGAPTTATKAAPNSSSPMPSTQAPLGQSQSQPSSSGFWLSVGAGFGSLGCNICVGYLGGVTGNVSFGASLSPKVLVGVGASGWTKSIDGETVSAGTVDARLRFYPRGTSGLFLTGGAGLGTMNAGLATDGKAMETGIGFLLGVGMDFRMANRLSLTPFWNGFAVKTSASNVWVSQLGLGMTLR